MYDQREPLKYGSTYLPRQSSSSRRFKNGQRSFMSKPSDFIIIAVIVVASGVASMWFISRLPYILEGASSVYGWATDITLTWGTPSMWWLFVNLIVGAIVLSSGFVSAFGSNSGTDPYQPVYIEKGISDPASPGVPLDSSSDIPEESVGSYVEDSFRYVPPAKSKAAVPIPYAKIQPEYEAAPVYEATPVYETTPVQEATDQHGAEQASPAENIGIHAREIPAPVNVSESLPVVNEPPPGYPVPFPVEPIRSVEVEAAEPDLVSSRVPPLVSSRGISPPVVLQGEPEVVSELRSVEPEVLLSRSIPSAGVAGTEADEEVAFANQDNKVVADEGMNAPVRNVESNDGSAREIEDPPIPFPPAPAFYDPFTVIDDPPIGYGKLQRNFTEGSINYVRPDEPLISAPPPKAELVKAHTFTSGRAIRRDQIDSYVEPLARKIEEMKKRDEEMKRRDEINRKAFHSESTRDEINRKGFHAETMRTHNRDAPVETMARDTRPTKVHSRNSSVDVTAKDIQHSYPTEVFYPPPVQVLPADIAHYFSSAHQAPPGEAELRQVTPAPPPAVVRPPPKKVAPAEVPERSVSKKTPSVEVSERPPSKKTAPTEAPERMTSTRKPPPGETSERTSTEQAPPVEAVQRPPSKKAETVTVESVPARVTISKKTAALEALADKLHRPKKAPADGLSDLLQRPPTSKKAPPSGGSERDLSKQTSQTETMQRSLPKQTLPVQTPLQNPIPPPPVIKTSPPSSPPAPAPARKQGSRPEDDFSPPSSPPVLRPPPPPPHFKIPPPLDVKDPYKGLSSDDTSGFKFYATDGRNPSPKNEASSSADVSARSAKYAVNVEEVYQAPAPKMSSVRSYRTDPGASTSQNPEHGDKSRLASRRTRNRPPPAPEPSVSDSTESEITEEGKEHDDLHQQIESFLARMHEDMRLQRQESMARNIRIKHEFNHDD